MQHRIYVPGEVQSSEVAAAFLSEAEYPTDGDEVIAAFSRACLELYTDETSNFRTWLDEGLNDRTAHELSLNDIVNMTLRLFQRHYMQHDPAGYPGAEYEDPNTHKQKITELLSDDAEREVLHTDIVWREIQSNLVTRSLPLQLVLLSEQGRIGKHPSILEIGCSDGQLLKAFNGDYGLYEDVEFVAANPETDIVTAEDLEVVSAATAYVKELLSQPYQTGPSVGVDLFNPNDIKNMQWIFACSFRPKELRDPAKRELFQRLQEIRLQPVQQYPNGDTNLYYYWGDFSEDGMSHFEHESAIQEFDVVMFPTVLYMEPEKAAEKLQLARRFLKKDGIIIVQDRVRLSLADPAKLKFFGAWGLLNYRLLVQYPNEADNKFYEIFKMVSDRAKQIMAGKDIGRIAIGDELEELSRRCA